MQDFDNYSYVININKLQETVKKALDGGYPVTVVINGEYYDVDLDGSKQRKWERERRI